MLNSITDGISIKLDSVFGKGYEIYGENVKQGLEEPCFFIKPLKVINKPLLGKRKQRTYPFDIAYFPKEGNAEMMEVSEKALDGLEYITLTNGDVLRGTSLESEIVDGVLHISVNYIVFLNDTSTGESMEGVTTDIGVKGVGNGN